MNNKKAFTLVELLGILIILGVIALVAFPSLLNSYKKSTEKEYERFLKDMELITESYLNDHLETIKLSEPGDSVFIDLVELVDGGYLSKKKVNPKTKEEIQLNTSMIVTLLNDYTKKYEYTGKVSGIYNYISDNLKVLYDGYTKLKTVDNKVILTDFMGNADGELINGLIQSSWDTNKIKLGGTNNYINLSKTIEFIQPESEVTIEIVYQLINNSDEILLRSSGLGLNQFNLYKGGIVRSVVRDVENTVDILPTANRINLTELNSIHTLSMTISKNNDAFDFNFYGDGRPLATDPKTGLKIGNDIFKIGIDNELDVSSPVYIYGYRIYDQTLSSNDIEHNYQIDINRFDWRK
ncbi:MAG: prepilin-type N-terminal cleavage/methylation domain-containing protein [Bacilli bacterium]